MVKSVASIDCKAPLTKTQVLELWCGVAAMTSGASQAYKRIGRNNPFLRYGIPMISLTILGSLGLSHLQQGRKDVVNAREDVEWAAIAVSKSLSREGPLPDFDERQKKKIDLEQELKAFREKVDIDAYEYKPVPKLRNLE